MNKFYIAIFVVLCFSACSKPKKSKQEIAQENIHSYLMSNLNDTSGYQSMAFDSLITDSTSYLDQLADDIYTADTGIIETNFDSLKASFKPEFIGYKIRHKFRAKNGFGATIINNRYFYLDTALKVKSMEDK